MRDVLRGVCGTGRNPTISAPGPALTWPGNPGCRRRSGFCFPERVFWPEDGRLLRASNRARETVVFLGAGCIPLSYHAFWPQVENRPVPQTICAEFPRYGYRRVTAQLQAEGERVNHKRVSRIMREQGLRVRPKRRFVVTTNGDHDGPIFPDLAKDLTPTGPDQLWVADLTSIRIPSGFVYLAVILDAWSRRVVGWAISRRIDADLGSRHRTGRIARLAARSGNTPMRRSW
ncbi:MAG TPA: IS3 family transposase [Geminicoccaceae bacterium]|nr:IS3 family transposase [Geminicoccaceae bacterium]